jgi:hypothetical protein
VSTKRISPVCFMSFMVNDSKEKCY